MSQSQVPSAYNGLRTKAQTLDASDSLRHTRDEFRIPTKAETKTKALKQPDSIVGDDDESSPCTYLCGNSLGLMPRRSAARIQTYLETWGSQGVLGHQKKLEDSPLPNWFDVDDWGAKLVAPIVGAAESEVAVMQTLTVNLHLLMTAFYRPDPKGRYKIILEGKAFPSDHYVVWSQVHQHGLSPETSIVTIESAGSEDNVLNADDIESVITQHAKDTAVILLPGIQYYTGQLLDIAGITALAHKHGIFIIWDLAHAVGNVPLSLSAWDVDAAAWCSYKYLNGGPGCIGGLFIHHKHSNVEGTAETVKPGQGFQGRLAGWWGNEKTTRFGMTRQFHPMKGAAGFQLSNPSVLDITALGASLEIFAEVKGVDALHVKSRRLTAFLLDECLEAMAPEARRLFYCITPADPDHRGAQVSLRLVSGDLLDGVMKGLEERAVVIDERRPDVVRVAPAPLYNTFEDCVDFAVAFEGALLQAVAEATPPS